MPINHDLLNTEIRQLAQQAMPLDYDADFVQFLRNKRVAIVGPAETLLGTKSGKTIDSYDVIVRFNDAIRFMPFGAGLAEDIGTRTDILYCNYKIIYDILNQDGISHEKFVDVCREVGIKYFICPNNNLSYQRSGEATSKCDPMHRESLLAFKQFLSRNGSEAKFRMLYATTETLNRWIEGYIGRTGAIAILDILAHDIEQLFVGGMTFYHQGGHLFLDQPWDLHPFHGPGGVILTGPESHNSYLELDLMKLLIKHLSHKMQVDGPLGLLLSDKPTRDQRA